MRPVCDSARRARPLLGTVVEITARGAPRAELDAGIDAAFCAVADVHRLMSFHDPGSDVSRLNRDAASRAVRVHAWTYRVLSAAHELHAASTGRFDIAVAPLLQHLGRLPYQGGEPRSVGITASGIASFELLGDHHVRFARAGVRIDVGGIAKGFAVDRAIDVLRGRGVPEGVVNAGGDLAAFGSSGCLVDLRDPRHPRRLLCRIAVQNEALASSGGAFDPFETAAATAPSVLDPGTCRPARAVSGVTVRAGSCVLADALTKVVMIAAEGAGPLLERYHASAMLVTSDGELRATRRWLDAVSW
jgi:thiamine biosynthesis lipoprotein